MKTVAGKSVFDTLDEILTPDSMVMAFRSTFRPEAARGLRLSYEIHLGNMVLTARIENAKLTVSEGAAETPDLVLESGPAIKDIMTGDLEPAAALESGTIRVVDGNPALLDRFAQLFRIPAKPA